MTTKERGARFEGPLETGTFPEKLRARVVTPGESPRVHGYDVEGDLARHYDFVSIIFLYLTGELPSPIASAAAQVALIFASPVSVAHASVHSSVLSRLCGGTSSSLVGASAVGLAEQARHELEPYADLLEWLAHPTRNYPEVHQATSDTEREGAQRLLEALPSGYQLPIMGQNPTRWALILAIFRDAGLRRREQFEAVIALVRMPSALSEAFAERPTNFARYPINLPPIIYRDPRD